MNGYKHFVRVDSNNIVIEGYADWETEKRKSDEIPLSGEYTRQFQTQLINNRLQFAYKLVNGVMTLRTQAELDAEWNARPPEPPTTEDRLAAAEAALLSIMGL